jgi:3-oxoadipate enol-lactonase
VSRVRGADLGWAELAWDLLDLSGDIDETNGPIDAIGASMGTGTLLHAAVRAPHRFRRLVLSVPPTYTPEQLSTWGRAAVAFLNE